MKIIEKYKNELKNHYDNYIKEKNFNDIYLGKKYFQNFLKIIYFFSNNPLLSQEEIFNLLKFKKKENLIFLNEIIRNSAIAQKIITKEGIGKKYWNTIMPYANIANQTLENQYRFPQRIALFPGVSCMFFCGFCGRNQSEKYPTTILNDSKETFDKLFSQIPSTTALSISGGLEPLTNPKIGEIITSAKKNNIRIPLITNGYPLTENFVKNNPGIWNLDSLRVSLYGIDKESYKFSTRVEKSFDIVKKNVISFLKLRNIHKKNLKFGFNFIIAPENINQINGILDLVKDINDHVGNENGVNFLTLRDDYQSVTGKINKFDKERKNMFSEMNEQIRRDLINYFEEFKIYKTKLCPDLYIDYGYSLDALSNNVFDKGLVKVEYKNMRNFGFTQLSVAIDLYGDVFLYREAGFLNRKGNEKFIIGRINKKQNLEDVIKKFLEKKIPIIYKYQDERFMDSFDHVLTSLVNQAEKDKNFGIPFKKGPVLDRIKTNSIELGNNWYS